LWWLISRSNTHASRVHKAEGVVADVAVEIERLRICSGPREEIAGRETPEAVDVVMDCLPDRCEQFSGRVLDFPGLRSRLSCIAWAGTLSESRNMLDFVIASIGCSAPLE
jgi:hypothetical protein